MTTLALLALVLGGCGADNQPATPNNTTGTTTTTAPETARKTLQIKGSDTEVNLVQHEAEAFMKVHPDISVAVTGGGSGTGVAALLDGTADIADASRDLKGQEKVDASRKNVTPTQAIIATDAVSIIVNEKNPLATLSVDQVGALFKGDAKSFDDVGGKGQATLYGRQSNSGTFEFMKEHVVKGDFAQAVRQMNGNAEIVEAVKGDATGIGYVGVGYVAKNHDGIKILTIGKNKGDPGISPLDKAHIDDGTYPIMRPLNQFTNGVATGPAGDFIKFELSPDGQKIAVDEGFYEVAAAYQATNAPYTGGAAPAPADAPAPTGGK